MVRARAPCLGWGGGMPLPPNPTGPGHTPMPQGPIPTDLCVSPSLSTHSHSRCRRCPWLVWGVSLRWDGRSPRRAPPRQALDFVRSSAILLLSLTPAAAAPPGFVCLCLFVGRAGEDSIKMTLGRWRASIVSNRGGRGRGVLEKSRGQKGAGAGLFALGSPKLFSAMRSTLRSTLDRAAQRQPAVWMDGHRNRSMLGRRSHLID